MTKFLRRGVAATVAVMTIAVISISSVSAQDDRTANGFRLSPVRSEFTIEKGKSQTLTISIENPSDAPTKAKAIINNFIASQDETGTPRLILDDRTPEPKNSFKNLIDNNLPEVQLNGKERKNVQVRISIPADANAGGYYGAIRFAPSNTGQESTVGLTASVGTIVLVTVPGNLNERLDLLQLSAAQNGKAKAFFTGGSVESLVRVKNMGDIHVKPFGKVVVKNMFGKQVASYELNNTEPRANVLPGSVRKFVDPVSGNKFFGRYTLEANLGYSQNGGELISAKGSFWYVPAWALVALLILMLVAATGIYLLTRRFRGQQNHRVKK